MAKWLEGALDYIPRWIEHQMRLHEQPGCVIAIGFKNRLLLEQAFGRAGKGVPLTPRHRFRVASHSKTFAAAAMMKLAGQRRLRLEDPAGRYVAGLHPAIARATIADLLSHGAGIVRDGADAGQFVDRRPFLSRAELMADLARPPVLARRARFKYSNHGYGLVGLIVEAATGEPYPAWLKREIIDAAHLEETFADAPVPAPLASGHTSRLPTGKRHAIPGNYSTRAIAPAGGVVSTARDLVSFFGQLAPSATQSVLSRESRRRMLRRRWRDPYSSIERYYGLGIMSGTLAGWDWFGHSGGLQGYITRTLVLPKQELAVCVLTNAIDGLAHPWIEGAVHILRAFERNGGPSRRTRAWAGRWWSLWNTLDLVAMRSKVIVANPALFNPLSDAPELTVQRPGMARISLAGGFSSHGEPARLADGEFRLGGARLVSETRLAREIRSRYRHG